jgi:hypothetical protein
MTSFRRSTVVTALVALGALLLVLGNAAMTARPAEAQAASCWSKIYADKVVAPGVVLHDVYTGHQKFDDDCLTVHDNRINANTLAAPIAIYCQPDGIAFWDINSISQGTKAFFVAFSYIDQFPAVPTENTLLASEGGYSFYRLTSGELQLNSPPNWEGKSYTFVFTGCEHPEQQHSTMQ